MGANISTLQSKPILIAEVGNNHFGDMKRARGLILQAASCGANLVKLQAIDERQVGSMPSGFYKECSFTTAQYVELIGFGKDNGIEVFCTIVSDRHESLHMRQNIFKIPGYISKIMHDKMNDKEISFRTAIFLGEFQTYIDFLLGCDVFASIPEDALSIATDYCRHGFTPLFVSKYFTETINDYGFLENIKKMASLLKPETKYGYSDHTLGTRACEMAIKQYGCTIIEKHFTDKKYQSWNGHVYRDTVFAADNGELESIAKMLGG